MKYEPKTDPSQVQSQTLNGISSEARISEQISVSEQPSNTSDPTKTESSAKMSSTTCNCEPCLERRTIEADQRRHKKLIHAKTQIHHLISCIYHGAFFYTTIDTEELKSCVDLLMSQEPDLLFRKVDILCQEFVSGMTTRLLQLLTNGFNTPVLACNFVESMFEDFTRLMNCSSKLISFFPQLEKHLSRFNHATLKNHHMNLFQAMVFNQATINRTLSEIVNQLRQGSAQYETKHENKFSAALMRFHKFETKMHEICVMWRDVQKLLDDYHDEKAEERLNDKKQQPSPQPAEPSEKWEFYKVEQETARQLRSKKSKMFLGNAEKAKLSVTLRKSFPFAPSTCALEEPKNPSAEKHGDESDTDPPFESPLNSDESLSEVHFQPPLTPTSDANATAYLCTEYLQNIHPPSVPSGDSDPSSDNNEFPQIQDHALLAPLEPEHDSIGSLSPQPCTNDVVDTHVGSDVHANDISLCSTSRPFLATYQHLHQLQKQLFNPSEPSNHVSPSRSPSPTVKTKVQAPHKVSPQAESNVRDSNGSPSGNNSNFPSAALESTAAEILVDLPRMTSDHSPFFGDAWSSPSSSSSLSNAVVSFAKDASSSRTRNKTIKLKKKKSISRSKHKVFTDSDTTNNNSQAFYRDSSLVGGEMSHDESNDASKDENETEDNEDADDEYDGDEEQSDLCKCSKCRHLLKSYQNKSFFVPETDQDQYLLQDFHPALVDNRLCKCLNCVQLENASNYFAAQSSQVSCNVAGYSSNDIADPNHQSHFYNQNISSHFLIQPHLYGFHPMGTSGAIGQFYGQAPSALSSSENQFNDAEKSSTSPKIEDSQQQETDTSNSGNAFPHLAANSSGWGALGKSPNAKFAVTHGNATPTSLHDWPVSGHQTWLPTPGNVLPHQILSPGCASAFQHYISTRPQGFFSPFLSSTGSLAQSPGSYFPPLVDTDRTYASSAEAVSSSSPTSVSSADSSTSSTLFSTSSTSPSVSTFTSSSSAFTPTSSKYFPSLYAQIPGLTTSSVSPFTMAPSTSSASVPVTSATHAAVQGQPMHFHPGTSVSLKDGAPFNLALHDGPNLMFNQALPQFSGERPGFQPGSSQNVFTIPTTLSQTSCLPPNPFLQSVPLSSTTHTGLLGGYPNTQAQNPSVSASNVSNLSSTTSANSIQIRNHILRRKKLVAQSKLSKQPRPQQHLIKSHDPGVSGDSQSTLIPQKLARPQPMISKPELGMIPPGSDDQTTSITIVSSPSSDNVATVNQPPVKELDLGKVPNSPASASKAESQPTVNNAKQPDKPQAIPSEHQQPPNYQHPPAVCRVRGDGNAANEAQATANSAAANNLNNKYCNCCYCEFFGNGGPTNAQANRNTKIRERLQRKLHTKAKESENTDGKTSERKPKKNLRPASIESSGTGLPPVNDLVSFIEGDKRSHDGAGKKSKKGRQKQQKKEAKQNEDIAVPAINEKVNVTQPQSNMDKTVKEKHHDPNQPFECEETAVNGTERSNPKSKKKKGKAEEKIAEKKVLSPVIQQNGSRTKSSKNNGLHHDKVLDKTKHDAKLKHIESDESKNSIKSQVNGRSKMEKVKEELETTKNGKKVDANHESRFKSDVEECSLTAVGSNPSSANKMSEHRSSNEKIKQNRKANKVNSSNPSSDVKKIDDRANPEQAGVLASLDRSSTKSKLAGVDSTQRPSNRKKDAKELNATQQTKLQEVDKSKNDSSQKHLDQNGFSSNPVSSKSEPVPPHVKNGFVISKTVATETTHVKERESSTETKKSRSRKQRKKNRHSTPSLDNSDLVDQVFLPRAGLEEDSKELDDTELEIENFKRFCLNSSVLNKQKKITVKWKELNLKKNHFPN